MKKLLSCLKITANGLQVGDVADLRSEKLSTETENKDMKNKTLNYLASGNSANLLLAVRCFFLSLLSAANCVTVHGKNCREECCIAVI